MDFENGPIHPDITAHPENIDPMRQATPLNLEALSAKPVPSTPEPDTPTSHETEKMPELLSPVPAEGIAIRNTLLDMGIFSRDKTQIVNSHFEVAGKEWSKNAAVAIDAITDNIAQDLGDAVSHLPADASVEAKIGEIVNMLNVRAEARGVNKPPEKPDAKNKLAVKAGFSNDVYFRKKNSPEAATGQTRNPFNIRFRWNYDKYGNLVEVVVIAAVDTGEDVELPNLDLVSEGPNIPTTARRELVIAQVIGKDELDSIPNILTKLAEHGYEVDAFKGKWNRNTSPIERTTTPYGLYKKTPDDPGTALNVEEAFHVRTHPPWTKIDNSDSTKWNVKGSLSPVEMIPFLEVFNNPRNFNKDSFVTDPNEVIDYVIEETNLHVDDPQSKISAEVEFNVFPQMAAFAKAAFKWFNAVLPVQVDNSRSVSIAKAA